MQESLQPCYYEIKMSIISWNVQGIKKAQVLQEILFLKRLHNPQLIFLLETSQ